MLLFNSNAFLLGIIVFLTISLTNFTCFWLCRIWKVKIIEFSIFLNPWFSLFKKEINGTVYKLGWLPVGGYIRPLGMLKEDLESIPAAEQPFTFLSKSGKRQVIFRLIPTLGWVLVLLLSLFALNGPGNVFQATEEMFNYILFAGKTMFGFNSASELVQRTNIMLVGKNVISFALILATTAYLILNALSKIMSILTQSEKKFNKLTGYIVTIIALYLTFWKIPTFVFSFFSFRLCISYLVSFSLSLYLIGSVVFILAMSFVKLTNRQPVSI